MSATQSARPVQNVFGWDADVLEGKKRIEAEADPQVRELPVAAIRRPIPRANS